MKRRVKLNKYDKQKIKDLKTLHKTQCLITYGNDWVIRFENSIPYYYYVMNLFDDRKNFYYHYSPKKLIRILKGQ